jgi:hypothetical protein
VSVIGLTDVAAETCQLYPRKYVVAVYNTDFYVGCIIAHNDEECDILVKFMERKGQNILTFSWTKEKINAIFPLFMFCVQCQHHHCMEGVDNSGLSMLLQT